MTTASFGAISFKERGVPYPLWSKGGIVVIKHIAGSDKNVIQKLGLTRPRLAMSARVTASALTSLYAALGTSATLTFSFEAVSATLESIDPPEEFYHGLDFYTVTLHFIRSSGDFSSGSGAGARVTESGDTRVTESGDTRIVE